MERVQVASRRRVLPAAEGGLGAERVSQFLIGDDLQERIVAQTARVVGVLVASDDLIDALAQQVMAHAIVLPRIAQPCGPVAGQMMTLIEGAQGQQSGIAGNLPAGKIRLDELLTVEGESELWYNTLYQTMMLRKGVPGPQPQCS